MPQMSISSRDFNQDVSKAKRASLSGPVFITDRGKTAHVLLNIKEYQKICGNQESIVDLLAMPDVENFNFEVLKVKIDLFKPVEF